MLELKFILFHRTHNTQSLNWYHSSITSFSLVRDMLTNWNKNVTFVLRSTTILWKWTFRKKQYYSDEHPCERRLCLQYIYINSQPQNSNRVSANKRQKIMIKSSHIDCPFSLLPLPDSLMESFGIFYH